jgi:RecA/RadA recombinase
MPREQVTDLSKRVGALQTKLNRSPEVKGARVMVDIDDAPNTYFLRRPCGIMPLDIHTGGGLPAGGLTYLSGPDGAGKTFLLYKYLAMNQRLYGERSCVALAVSESAPDHFFMRKAGMQIAIPEVMIEERQNNRKNLGLPQFTKDELKLLRQKTVGQVKVLRGANGEELLMGILECFESKAFDLVTLDSVSAVLPEADASKDLDENAKRAASASMLTRFFQHYLNGTTGYFGMNPTTVIFTSQVRSNSKKAEAPAHIAKYLPDYAPQGAWAAKHGKLIDILVKHGQKDKEEVTVPGAASDESVGEGPKKAKKRVQVGKTVQYEVLKGKAGVHEGITGEFEFAFPGNATEMYDMSRQLTEDQRTVIVTALQTGLAEEKDGFITFHSPLDNKPLEGVTKIAGINRLVDMMRADFQLELKLRRYVLNAAGIECAYG